VGRALERWRDAPYLYWIYKINKQKIVQRRSEMKAEFKSPGVNNRVTESTKGESLMISQTDTNVSAIRNKLKGKNEMKSNTILFTGLALILALILISNSIMATNTSARSNDQLTLDAWAARYQGVADLYAHKEGSLSQRGLDAWAARYQGVAGLVSLSVVPETQAFIAITHHFTIVYQAPQAGPTAAFVLMPETEVSLAGRSTDGKWLSLQNGWVQVDDLRTNADLSSLPIMQVSQSFSGVTIGLTMVYQSPTMSSRVVDVLSPVSIVSLSGRSTDGDWLAVANKTDPGSIKGWVGRGDLQTGDLAALPVMGMALEILPGVSYAGLGNEN
jgi:hypothetical protein